MSEFSSLRDSLNKFVNDSKAKKLQEDRSGFVSSVAGEVVKIFGPVLQEIAKTARFNREDIKNIAEEVTSRISVPDFPRIEIPEAHVTVDIPEIRVPKPEVTVNIPPIKVPEIKWPSENLPIEGWVRLQGVDLGNPLPVQLRDAKGNPVNLLENLTTIIGGSSGGGFRRVRIDNPSTDPVPMYIAGSSIATSAASIVDSTGAAFEGANPFPVYVASGSQATSAVSVVDSTGAAFEGANPLPITGNVNVNGSLNSVLATGATLHDAADDGDAPIKIGGIAMTANPAAVAGGDRVSARLDVIGRQLVRPIQVRDLMQTAYVSLTTGTETTLLAGVSGVFFDLLYVMGTNNSDAAVTVDLRSATAAGIVTSIRIPANGTAGVSLSVPLPQDTSATTWTADLPDITGTTVTLGALFSREV